MIKLIFAAFILSVAALVSCNSKRAINMQGFYRDFSYEKQKGISRLDTTISKGDNKLDKPYCYVDSMNDSTLKIIFFENLKTGFYNDGDSSVTLGFRFSDGVIYETDINSNANGPGKKYAVIAESIYSELILHYYLPGIYMKPSKEIGVWLERVDIANDGRHSQIRRFLLRDSDTVNFRSRLKDYSRFDDLFRHEVKDY